MTAIRSRDIGRAIQALIDIPSYLSRMEKTMAKAKDQLNALSSKVDDLVADVRAARETLEADRENLSADGQAALDELSAKIDAFDAEVGDADGSDVPAPQPGEGENPQAPVTTETPSEAGQTDQGGDVSTR